MFNKKILCLGTNTTITDNDTNKLASKDKTINHGLIIDSTFIPKEPGYYHSSITDIWSGGVIEIAKNFDVIKMLDQPYKEWNHWKSLLSTYKIMVELEKQGYQTEFRNNESLKSIVFMSELVEKNKRFCVYPWIHLLEEFGNVYICSKTGVEHPIKKLKDIDDWQADPEFTELRRKMLAGEYSEKCQNCYKEQDMGFTSTRVHESMDWAAKLNIQSIEDLNKFKIPVFYEVRPSNKCNLACRMCAPHNSHLLDKEFKTIGIEHPFLARPHVWGTYDHIDVPNLLPGARVYSTGGEPTIIPEFYEFLEKCVDLGRTDLDITLNTNAQKISDKLINILSKFDDINLSVSIDGYGKVNDYIRWGSTWDTVVKNIHRLKDAGFYISFEAIPGIWNITNLHLLYEFVDREFPDSTMFLQQTYWNDDSITILNHPNPALVIDSMTKIKQTKMYYTDARDNKSMIDTIFDHYSDPNYSCNIDTLKTFFEFNDTLDKSRNIKLVDYIPELEECRKLIN
jgi:sulfatase maturation enzyme AslB (radical SAM superfamily)